MNDCLRLRNVYIIVCSTEIINYIMGWDGRDGNGTNQKAKMKQ